VDFRRTRNKLNAVSVLGKEVVEKYRYLEVSLEKRLHWKAKKRQSRL